jgi:hypothetical protein
MAPLARGVDHLTIRVNDAQYGRLYALFSDTFRLPIAWPVAERYPGAALGFKSGGIAAGSINLEIFRAGACHPTQAQLYSIALTPAAPLAETLAELDSRGIPHLPPLGVPQDSFGAAGKLWTLVFLGGLFGADLASVPPPATGTPGRSLLGLRFDHVFRRGMAFLCDYNRALYDVARERARTQAELAARRGGPLGFRDVREVVVAAADIAAARAQWQKLLGPGSSASGDRWDFGEGPALRLVSGAVDSVAAIVCSVASLERARAFLSASELLGTVSATEIAVAPEKALGLDIRLRE